MLRWHLIFHLCTLLVCISSSNGSGVDDNRPLSGIRPGKIRQLPEQVVGTESSERKPRLRPVSTHPRFLPEQVVGVESTERKPSLRSASTLSNDHLFSRSLHEDFPFQSLQERKGAERGKAVNPLLSRVSTGYVCVLFGMLIWRSLAAYEMANEFASHSVRLLATTPVVVILIANIVGLAVNLFQPLNFKNHLKAILAANVLREWTEAIYNVFMLFFASTHAGGKPMGEYVVRIFVNFWWSVFCFSYIKSRWVLHGPPTSEVANNIHSADEGYQQ